MIVNNYELIHSLLSRLKEDGCVFDLMIIQRKKDNPKHKSGKIIYRKLLHDDQSLFNRMDLIIRLCEEYKARAYINLNPKRKEDICKKLAMNAFQDFLYSHNYEPESLLWHAVGETKGVKSKRSWVVDIDHGYISDLPSIKKAIEEIHPIGDKVIMEIPTRSGVHLIAKPFNLQAFKSIHPNIDVHKDNPSLLYYPNSLDEEIYANQMIIEGIASGRIKLRASERCIPDCSGNCSACLERRIKPLNNRILK